MKKIEITEIVKNCIIDILGDIDGGIDITKSLKEYGATSIDRADISIDAMKAIGCKIPLVEFGTVNNIEGLVNVLYEKQYVK